MKNSRLKLLAGAVVIGALALTACSGGAGDGGGTGEASSGGDVSGKKVYFLTMPPTVEYAAVQGEEFKRVAEEAGIEVTELTNNFDPAQQAQQVNQAIAARPDAIVIWPSDANAVIPSLQAVTQAQIPLIVSTSIPNTEDTNLWDAFSGPDNYEHGVRAAEAMVAGWEAAGLGDSGSVIAIEGTPGHDSAFRRQAGFEDTLAEIAPGIKVVGAQTANWDQSQATDAAAALLTQYAATDVKGIFAHSDVMLAGAITAAERAGYTPGTDLIAVGIDCTIEGYRNIEAGKQYASNLQDPHVDGGLVAENLIAVLSGESVEKVTYMDTPTITADNLSTCAAAVGEE